MDEPGTAVVPKKDPEHLGDSPMGTEEEEEVLDHLSISGEEIISFRTVKAKRKPVRTRFQKRAGSFRKR